MLINLRKFMKKKQIQRCKNLDRIELSMLQQLKNLLPNWFSETRTPKEAQVISRQKQMSLILRNGDCMCSVDFYGLE